MLLASIHDVSPRFEAEAERLLDLFVGVMREPRVALLVVPDYWGEAPIRAGTPFARRLRRWRELGVEIFLHGWSHRDTHVHPDPLRRLMASQMTAGEGEFLGLDRAQARARLEAGRSLLEDVTGHPVAGFVAPAWLYGPGALEALAELGFPLAEDHFRVWRPVTGEVVARGPVVTWASRTRGRMIASLAAAAAARAALKRTRVQRVAAHPGDTAHPVLMQSVRRTLESFAAFGAAGRYTDLLRPAPPAALGAAPLEP